MGVQDSPTRSAQDAQDSRTPRAIAKASVELMEHLGPK
jgi:hypothetical protein